MENKFHRKYIIFLIITNQKVLKHSGVRQKVESKNYNCFICFHRKILSPWQSIALSRIVVVEWSLSPSCRGKPVSNLGLSPAFSGFHQFLHTDSETVPWIMPRSLHSDLLVINILPFGCIKYYQLEYSINKKFWDKLIAYFPLIRSWLHRKRRLQQFFYCCVYSSSQDGADP
jgi:hypothetical protein